MTTSNHNEPGNECDHTQGCGTPAPGSPEADSPTPHLTVSPENEGEKGKKSECESPAPATSIATPPGHEPTEERHGSVDPLQAVHPVRIVAKNDVWTVDCEMSDGTIQRMGAREAEIALRAARQQQATVLAFTSSIFPPRTGEQIARDLEAVKPHRESLRLERVEGDPEACEITRKAFNPGFPSVTQRISALLDHVYPDTDLDRELEEAELLSRCYSLPYSIEEIGAAFIAVRKNPANKLLAIKATKDCLNIGLQPAKEIVDAVAEKIGAYPHVCRECKVGNGHAEWCSQHKQPIAQQRRANEEAKGQKAQKAMAWTGLDKIDGLKAASSGADPWNPQLDRKGYPIVSSSSSPLGPLDALTQRAVNDFLGAGAHRTHGLRGMLRFLTQEDLVTVLAECVVLIDDEHLGQCMKMLGPDEVEALNSASAGEIRTRALDIGGLRGFPLRPLTAQESREPIIETQRGTVLEKDVSVAMDYLDRDRYRYDEEAELAERLESREGWNSVYASAVADEAWKRYYREPEDSEETGEPEDSGGEDNSGSEGA